MSALFGYVLELSFSGIFLIILAILIRSLYKRIPGVFMCCIWGLVFINLVCPFSFKIPYSPFSSLQSRYAVTSEYRDDFQAGANTLPAADETGTADLKGSFSTENILSGLCILWISVAFGLVALNTAKLSLLKNRLKNAVNLYENVYTAENIPVPFTMGMIHPKIYLSPGIGQDEAEYVILHEKVHIRHRDNIIKTAAYTILALHWFNPLVWLAYKMFSEDMEKHCDETVLNEMGRDIKKRYSFTLLKLSSGLSSSSTSILEFGENTTKRRIKNILGYKKPTAVMTAVAIIMVAAVGCGAFISPSPTASVEAGSAEPEGFTRLSCELPFETGFSSETYTLSVSLPQETAQYCALEYYDDGNPLCLIKFAKDDSVANIGMFSFFGEDEYDAMDPSQMPVPTEVMRSDGIVVAFTGMQDSVFDPATEEGALVEAYHSALSDVLGSIEFSKK